MLKNKITTIGGATRDIMFYTDEMVLLDNKKDLLRQKLIAFEYGAKLYSKDVYLTYGGGGANTAISLASLGIKTQTILSLGLGSVGDNIIKNLKKVGVSIKLIQRSRLNTGTSFIINVGQNKEHVIFAYRGANSEIDLSKKVVQRIKTSWIYLTSLSNNFIPKLNNIFAHSIKKDISIAWNPGVDQLKLGLKKLSKYLKKTTVLIVNRDEALELLYSINKKTKNNIKTNIKSLHKYGHYLTVITDGPNGAYIYDGQKIYYEAALKRKGINTTGAGDAFGSTLIAGIIKYNWHLKKALHLAILNSNAVIMKIGAQEGLLKKKKL